MLIQRGGSPRPIDNFITHDDDGINWIKIGDVAPGETYITSTADKIIPEGASRSRWVYPGDLILSNSMSFGRPYILSITGCIHDGWLLIRDEKEMFNKEFLVQFLSSDSMLSQYQALAAGSTVNNLNKELVGSTTVRYPSSREQAAIGSFLSQLDNSIALHQRKSFLIFLDFMGTVQNFHITHLSIIGCASFGGLDIPGGGINQTMPHHL